MEKLILENIGVKPYAVIVGVFLIYFIYTENDKRETISKKDEVIMELQVREQKLNDELLRYALQLERKKNDEKETDSLLRKKTENSVKNILNNQ